MNEKLHIQHVMLSLQPGGLENGVVNVVNRLDPAVFRSSICCLKHGGEFVARLRPAQIKVHEFGWRGGNDFSLPFKLAKVFRETRTNIVHTRNAESFFYGFLGAKIAGLQLPAGDGGIQIIHSEHGRTFSDRAIRFHVQRWFSRYTHAIFSVSNKLKLDLVAHINIPSEQIQVLYNGVDLTHFKPVSRDLLRTNLGIEAGQIVVGSVGRLVAVKNYELLLRSMHALNMSHVVLVLVGDGGERQKLEALAKTLGLSDRVRFLGHRDDVAGLLPVLDIFVLPSLSEGMSNTLLEAMAAGVASVASDVGGNAEIIAHGQSGFIFPNGDGEALRHHLAQLVTDIALRERIANAGRARVISDFTIDAMISRYESLYKSVAKKLCRPIERV